MGKASKKSKLPPNQLATRVFPRIGEREPEEFDAATWSLSVDGLVKAPFTLSHAEFADLPRTTRTGTIHCVTRWSRPATTFGGVSLCELLERARPRKKKARFVRFVSGRGHDTTLPIDVARDDVLIADQLDLGEGAAPLPAEHGGPVRSVVFTRYFFKSVKWLRRIELIEEDRLGYWERTAGYHNGADPWAEERYVVRNVDIATLRRLLDARDLAGQDLLGADLREVDLSGFSLQGALLRNTRLRGVSLRGADLRDAHLCNADLRDADLSQAWIDGADFDGADLRGAILRGARGAPATLVGAQFVGEDGERPADLAGLDWSGAETGGLPDRQHAFLVLRGVIRDA